MLSSTAETVSVPPPPPVDVLPAPPCEILIEHPLDTNEIDECDVLLLDPQSLTQRRVSCDNTAHFGLSMADYCLLVSGADEIETSMGKYRLKVWPSGARRLAQCREFRGKLRPVATYTYELVERGSIFCC